MYINIFLYLISCIFVMITHSAMLLNVWLNGNYESITKVIILAAAVLVLDLTWFIVMQIFRQKSFVIDFLLILILNMGVIFQSCFSGGVNLSVKHYITCMVSLAAAKVGFVLCRNHKWIQMQKKYIYLGIGILMLVILTLTGSRSMWIEIGSITIQPSEFIKPLFVLACATSVAEQQNKKQIACFFVVYENFALYGLTAAICLLQWWCRDLGSLPTFVGIFAVGFFTRICYPKAKFSKKTLITAGVILLIAAIIALRFAPEYVQARLHTDIWNDRSGNGWQQSQALIAIADGGWFGKGAGNGNLHEVFAYENDIVFATISEEWGLVFALMVIFTIIMLVAIPLINPPRSYYHATMSAGVCAYFIMQMSLNIFGSCNLIPFTGVTIPFISAGGSSMIASGLMAGILMAAQSPEIKNPVIRRHTQ
ncbi:MAG: FtsW/RodA/SpoVE family cell cycle protein [Ruminococcus sp.]|nr:FtsW/RodA/SpoVE family cell cycle protein [Alistipes senegalensis]MDE6426736.1 FtsW/RodA/SpoVE family cell cycle protein [Ruminococcus sp.]